MCVCVKLGRKKLQNGVCKPISGDRKSKMAAQNGHSCIGEKRKENTKRRPDRLLTGLGDILKKKHGHTHGGIRTDDKEYDVGEKVKTRSKEFHFRSSTHPLTKELAKNCGDTQSAEFRQGRHRFFQEQDDRKLKKCSDAQQQPRMDEHEQGNNEKSGVNRATDTQR